MSAWRTSVSSVSRSFSMRRQTSGGRVAISSSTCSNTSAQPVLDPLYEDQIARALRHPLVHDTERDAEKSRDFTLRLSFEMEPQDAPCLAGGAHGNSDALVDDSVFELRDPGRDPRPQLRHLDQLDQRLFVRQREHAIGILAFAATPELVEAVDDEIT